MGLQQNAKTKNAQKKAKTINGQKRPTNHTILRGLISFNSAEAVTESMIRQLRHDRECVS